MPDVAILSAINDQTERLNRCETRMADAITALYQKTDDFNKHISKLYTQQVIIGDRHAAILETNRATATLVNSLNKEVLKLKEKQIKDDLHRRFSTRFVLFVATLCTTGVSGFVWFLAREAFKSGAVS